MNFITENEIFKIEQELRTINLLLGADNVSAITDEVESKDLRFFIYKLEEFIPDLADKFNLMSQQLEYYQSQIQHSKKLKKKKK